MPFLQFKGKTFVQNHHLAVPYHQLVPRKDKSLTPSVSLHDNLIVHGDNLHALKALLPTYAGRIKYIYIDPPYNTGNDAWVYNDNVSGPIIKEWIGKVVGKEGEDLTRHDKWLSMMMPRLKLLRELLSEDGVILVSINDVEVGNLRRLLDDVFGENSIAQFPWKGNQGAEDDTYYRTVHEYVLCYAKNKALFVANEKEKEEEVFSKHDEKKNRNYKTQLVRKWGSNSRRVDRPNLYYSVKAPDDTDIFPVLPNGDDGCWRWKKSKLEDEIAKDNVEFVKSSDGNWLIYEKIYEPKDGEKRTQKYNTWLDGSGTTSAGTKELAEIFSDRPEKVFDHPKPAQLIKHLFRLVDGDGDAIVLDAFAGSGTTAQAVLELNKEDDGTRSFILVQCDEWNDKDKAWVDISNEVTAERVRRVINGVPNSKNNLLKEGLGGSFSYFDLGEPIETKGILKGEKLPSYLELARYVYYTATGEEFDEKELKESEYFVGASSHYDVYMLYKPDIEYLKQTALTLNMARDLRQKAGSRPLLVFAPTKYVETGELDDLKIDFCQLPFEIYKVK